MHWSAKVMKPPTKKLKPGLQIPRISIWSIIYGMYWKNKSYPWSLCHAIHRTKGIWCWSPVDITGHRRGSCAVHVSMVESCFGDSKVCTSLTSAENLWKLEKPVCLLFPKIHNQKMAHQSHSPAKTSPRISSCGYLLEECLVFIQPSSLFDTNQTMFSIYGKMTSFFFLHLLHVHFETASWAFQQLGQK